MSVRYRTRNDGSERMRRMSTPEDMALARKVDLGEITQTELVEDILDDEFPDRDNLDLARRIVSALQY